MRLTNLFMLALCFFAWACATPDPQPNSNKGFFDHLSDLEEKAGADVPAQTESETPTGKVLGRFHEVDLSWPIEEPEVTSPFGPRGKHFHEGIDLRANVGTPVHAIHDGEVIYAGRKIHGYGRVLVVKHTSGLTSIYAHNSKLLVKSGAHVKRGQLIAMSGRSGRVRGPHVHFELRDGSLAFNPVELMGQAPLAKKMDDQSETGPIDDSP